MREAAPPAPARYEHFDGLRGLATAMVFFVHGVYQLAVAQPGSDHWWYRFAVHLDIAVPIFFAISGFLLYRPFLSATLAGRPVSVPVYAFRRLMRLVPTYWVALAIVTIWFSLHEVASLGGALRFGLFAQVYSNGTALKGIGQAWTLDVEMAFYVLLPVFALVLVRARRLRTAALGCAALAGVGVLWKVFAVTQTDAAAAGAPVWIYTLPGHLDSFAGGMLLAVASAAPVRGRALDALTRRPWLAWGLAGVLWVGIGALLDEGLRSSPPTTDAAYVVQRTLYALIAALLILPAVFPDDGRGAIRRLLRVRPIAALGIVSYSFYLWHVAAIGQMARWWDRAPHGLGWVAWIAAISAFAGVLGTVSYWLVERPTMRLRLAVRGRGRSATVDAVQAAP